MSGLALRLYHRLPATARTAAATAEGLYLRWWRYRHVTRRVAEEAREREYWSAERWNACSVPAETAAGRLAANRAGPVSAVH